MNGVADSPANILGNAHARGACPSLSAPMQTGDGLLVRLKPAALGLPPDTLSALADLGQRHGNGILEITARGNLQIRGLTETSACLLAEDVNALKIDPAGAPAIEIPPLAGLDPTEILDPRPLAEALRTAITHAAYRLAPKLAITLNGGGRLHLGAASADIRLDAVSGSPPLWRVAVGGTAKTARGIDVVSAENAVASVLTILRSLHERGPKTRGRDIAPESIHLPGDMPGDGPDQPDIAPSGVHSFDTGQTVLGVALAFGQVSASTLMRLMVAAGNADIADVRLAPGHALLLTGVEADRLAALQAQAHALGFITQADAPGNFISACAGAPACASAGIDTKDVAASLIATVPGLFDGSVDVHISGCAKGCAHPAPAGLTLAPVAGGIGYVLDGAAHAAEARFDVQSFSSAMRAKPAHETARQHLARFAAR
ncbi:precorrin-3B synthase [Rhizobium sp. CFBP 8762]|uniref:precorrin-3B synthase n=1 Tax=Rhizobium sp. CFBP 8762 TaxID=2775279 RepID=UPI00177C6DC6|nr:precorrin-3B synthase [Rhizobium sp. CFBP 8762]MBD8553740.1 precorrin-3B synthase [Rhizobium sp. CFBP 8762]